MANNIKSKEIALNGRLRTYEDPASIGPNDFVTLSNMRYTDTHPKTVNGMSVITDTGLASNINNVSQFRRAQPSENHILAHAGTSVYDLNAAAGVAGSFGSSIWTDTASGGSPRFASINGLSVYANGVGDTCVYGGDEYPVGSFIVTTSASNYDYSDAVNNTKTDAPNVAMLKTARQLADDSTLLLLHCDGTNGGTVFTDSSTTPKTATAFTGAVTSTTQYKFGITAGYFPGTGYLTIPDDTWANLSGGSFTIDAWVYINSGAYHPIYYQQTDANNYFKFYMKRNVEGGVGYNYTPCLQIYAASSEVVWIEGAAISAGGWHHVALVENGNSWYVFVDGNLSASLSDASRAADYSGVVQIGYDGTNYFNGYIDELRLSNTPRWTSSFSIPTFPYGNYYISTVYLGSIMPLAGVKLYVAESGGKTVDLDVNEWNGSIWNDISTSLSQQLLADNTAYTITWSSTASTSKMREYNKTIMYWYQLILSSATDFNDVTISQCTVRIPFQQIRDFWNGEPLALAAFLTYKSPNFEDNTASVSNDAYESLNEGSYAKLVSLTSSDYLVVGSTDRLLGIYLQFPGDKGNTAATTISVSYCNGTDSLDNSGAWTTVSGLVDGTKNGTKSLNKSGFVTWTPPTDGSEFKSAQWSSKNTKYTFNTYPLYYYKVSFSGATTTPADVRVSYAYGIPAQKTIKGFRFPVVHQDRLWLCGDMQGDKNYVLASSYQAPTVLGYDQDVMEFWLGDDTPVVAGASLFTRYGSTVSDVLVVCKQHEAYVIDGDSPDNYRQRRVSEHIGCIAPLSMVVVPMGDDAIPGTPRNIAVWLSQQGVMAFDGNNFVEISKDIHDKFDPAHDNYIGSSLTGATAFYDPVYAEYHLVIPGSSEYVYDVSRKKWYTVNRGSYTLTCGLPIYDTNGLAYTYGASGTKLYRLENGSTMAGESFSRSFRNGDMALPEGSVMEYARINWFMLIGKVMTNDITQAYYVDSANVSSLSTTITSTNSGKRLMNLVKHNKDLQATFHGFEFSVSDVFEPLYLALRYTIYPRETV